MFRRAATTHSQPASNLLLQSPPLHSPQYSPINNMSEFSFAQAQADMRSGYFHGAPGVLVSGLVWLVAALVAQFYSAASAVVVLLVGGMLIHPLGVLLCKLLGRSGSHARGNPLAALAGENTVWLMAGIILALALRLLRLEWFFPAMLLMIGGRYFTFQTVYGLRLYWLLGGTLCLAGLALPMLHASPANAALAGALLEILFAVQIFTRAKRSASEPA